MSGSVAGIKDLQVIIPAAGRGSRSGLAYPKCLFPVRGKAIIQRLLETLAPFDSHPVLVTSPDGDPRIRDSVQSGPTDPWTVVQPVARGMGDAILTAVRAVKENVQCRDALLVWSDIPFLRQETVRSLIQHHDQTHSVFTFATAIADEAYTQVERSENGEVTSVIETRESGRSITRGERDIGLFVFKIDPVARLLAEELPGKYGVTTGEHGFLYVIKHLVDRGHRVSGLPIAQPEELVSFNAFSDIEAYLQ